VESLFSNLPWEKLKKGTFDFIPSTVRIDKLEQLTILVDQEYSDGFFRHLGPLSLRFGIDKSEIVIVK
jgi:hypothetical protein